MWTKAVLRDAAVHPVITELRTAVIVDSPGKNAHTACDMAAAAKSPSTRLVWQRLARSPSEEARDACPNNTGYRIINDRHSPQVEPVARIALLIL